MSWLFAQPKGHPRKSSRGSWLWNGPLISKQLTLRPVFVRYWHYRYWISFFFRQPTKKVSGNGTNKTITSICFSIQFSQYSLKRKQTFPLDSQSKMNRKKKKKKKKKTSERDAHLINKYGTGSPISAFPYLHPRAVDRLFFSFFLINKNPSRLLHSDCTLPGALHARLFPLFLVVF